MTSRLHASALVALALCVAACRSPAERIALAQREIDAGDAASGVRRMESALADANIRDPLKWDDLGSLADGVDDDVARRAYDRAEAIAWPDARPKNVVRLSLPFVGRWTVTQGNRGEFSHSRLADRFAWDFQLVDETGTSNPPGNEAPAAFYGFGAPVLATADGVVVRAQDDVPDDEDGVRDHDRPAGNVVVLRHDTGEFSHFCHLRRGSVAVRVGQRVRRGETLGGCGCSGNAVEPHLHYVLRVGPTSEDFSVPARFDDVRAGDGVPREGDVVNASPGG